MQASNEMENRFKNFFENADKNLTLELELTDLKDFAFLFSQFLKPNTWVFLEGDLGAGKTTMVQHFAEALQSEPLTSPTFPILNVAKSEHPTIKKVIHADLYRIKSGRELPFLGLEEEFNPYTVAFIEWPEMVSDEDWDNFFDVTRSKKPAHVIKFSIEPTDFQNKRKVSVENFKF